MTSLNVQATINEILKFLGPPEIGWQADALTYFHNNDIKAVRLQALNWLNDSYCQALAILIDAKFQSQNLNYIFSSCTNLVAEHKYNRKLVELSKQLTDTINSNDPIAATTFIQEMLIPETLQESASLEAFTKGDYSTLRYWASSDSQNPFIKALNQLCHAHSHAHIDNPNLILILIKSARNAAKHYRTMQARELRSLIKKKLESKPG